MTTPPQPHHHDEHARIIEDAAAEHFASILAADRWVVACTYVTAGRARIAAVNTYDDLVEALIAFDQLQAELDEHQQAALMPVGPVTEAEMEAATPADGDATGDR